ncbi:MAG: ribosome silencing factor [Gammaproteobacteria bacterium]|nr:ribosome silencing factor [Gammaproteobacteria bacterium]
MNKLSKILQLLDDNQAIDIIHISVKQLTTMTDDMVICEGRSQKHMQSLAEKIEEDKSLREHYKPNLSPKGDPDWIIVDCGDVIIHILSNCARKLYELEKLWSNDH